MKYKNDKETMERIVAMTFSEEARKKYEAAPLSKVRMNTVDFAKARENAREIGPEALAVLMSHKNAGLIEVYEDEEAELAAHLSAAFDGVALPEFVDSDPEEAELSAYLSEGI